MMLFFLGAFYCLLLVRQNSNAGNWGRSLFWACAATSSSVAAFYTKLHLFGPFPVFVILYLGVFFYGSVRRLFFYKVLFISFLVSLLTAACFERFMDWPSFLRGWHETYSSIAFSGISLTAILPITDKIRIVFSTEYGLIFLYCLSFLFADIRKNTDLIALNVYILFPTLVFVARASAWGAHGFHYFMPFLAVGCIHAAYVIRQITFSSANVLQVNAAMRALVVVVAINISGLALGVAAHLTRIKQGREARQTYLELAALKPGDIMSEKLRENLINIGIINLGEYNYGPPSLMEVRLH